VRQQGFDNEQTVQLMMKIVWGKIYGNGPIEWFTSPIHLFFAIVFTTSSPVSFAIPDAFLRTFW
jgi:hypothetical protein